MLKDLFGIIALIIILFIVWIYTGGPQRYQENNRPAPLIEFNPDNIYDGDNSSTSN